MKSINRVLFFSLNLVVSFAILACVYNFMYVKAEKQRKGQNDVYESYFAVDKRLSDFGNTKVKIDEQKATILEDIRTYQDFLYNNGHNVGAYKNRVVKALDTAGISVKQKQKNGSMSGNAMIKQKNKDGNITLQIEMTASYEQLCRFLFEIEKYSIVHELKYDYRNNVYLSCSPVFFSKELDEYFSDKKPVRDMKKDSLEAVTYHEEIFNKTQKLKKSIGTILTWKDFKPIPHTPFYVYVPPKVTKTVYVGSAPDISIQGIMYDANDPIVIIGGKFYHLGDVYKGAKIVKINQSNIQTDFYGKIYTYKMKY